MATSVVPGFWIDDDVAVPAALPSHTKHAALVFRQMPRIGVPQMGLEAVPLRGGQPGIVSEAATFTWPHLQRLSRGEALRFVSFDRKGVRHIFVADALRAIPFTRALARYGAAFSRYMRDDYRTLELRVLRFS